MLEEAALRYYSQGYNCAETIVMAANEVYQLNLNASTVRLFAAFGGGLQCGDLCGCLCGGAGVLSAMFVASKAHDTPELKGYVQILVREFEKELGGRRCVEIKPRLYQKEIKCRNTVLAGARALEHTVQLIQNQ